MTICARYGKRLRQNKKRREAALTFAKVKKTQASAYAADLLQFPIS